MEPTMRVEPGRRWCQRGVRGLAEVACLLVVGHEVADDALEELEVDRQGGPRGTGVVRPGASLRRVTAELHRKRSPCRGHRSRPVRGLPLIRDVALLGERPGLDRTRRVEA